MQLKNKENKWNFTYKIINLINNKYYYGCHSTNNLYDNYFGSGKLLCLAIEKYGIENFKMKLLENFKTAKDMYKAEEKLISDKDINSNNCYNLKYGGFGGSEKGRLMSNNFKNKMSISLKGNNNAKGYKHTKEAKEKISKSLKGNKRALNMTHSYKTKKRIRDSHIGKKHKKEDREKISWSNSSGIFITPFGNFMGSVKASNRLGICPKTIRNICKNPNRIFTNRAFIQSTGVLSLLEKDIGKTYLDIGFGFIGKK